MAKVNIVLNEVYRSTCGSLRVPCKIKDNMVYYMIIDSETLEPLYMGDKPYISSLDIKFFKNRYKLDENYFKKNKLNKEIEEWLG